MSHTILIGDTVYINVYSDNVYINTLTNVQKSEPMDHKTHSSHDNNEVDCFHSCNVRVVQHLQNDKWNNTYSETETNYAIISWMLKRPLTVQYPFMIKVLKKLKKEHTLTE